MNSSAKNRILLDSTYLLPMLGVKVRGTEDTLRKLKRLRDDKKAAFYYTPFSLLEVLGKISKTRYNASLVAMGLTAINEEFQLATPTLEGYLKALHLKSMGFKDLIDLLLYTTALTNNLLFLTRDERLIDFLKLHGQDTSPILREDELGELL